MHAAMQHHTMRFGTKVLAKRMRNYYRISVCTKSVSSALLTGSAAESCQHG